MASNGQILLKTAMKLQYSHYFKYEIFCAAMDSEDIPSIPTIAVTVLLHNLSYIVRKPYRQLILEGKKTSRMEESVN